MANHLESWLANHSLHSSHSIDCWHLLDQGTQPVEVGFRRCAIDDCPAAFIAHDITAAIIHLFANAAAVPYPYAAIVDIDAIFLRAAVRCLSLRRSIGVAPAIATPGIAFAAVGAATSA
ncbi:hypothetical protein JNB91_25350 [Rhizobium wenxiniae]|nr:hypothetical protein [Rhizobium wenxiniae]